MTFSMLNWPMASWASAVSGKPNPSKRPSRTDFDCLGLHVFVLSRVSKARGWQGDQPYRPT